MELPSPYRLSLK
jgi:hypothetical protein